MVVWVWVVLAAAPVAPVRMAVPGITSSEADQPLANALTEKLIVLAKRPDLSIVSSGDIAVVLGLERQKQLLGCADDSANCMAELAGAIGADVLLRGQLIHAGTSYTLIVKIVRARDAREIASGTVRGSIDQVEDWIEAKAAGFAEQIVDHEHGRPARGGPSWLRFSAAALALVVAGVGGLSLGLAYQTQGRLRSPTVMMSAADVEASVSSGRAEQLAGFVLLPLGAVLAVAAAVLFGVYDPGSSP